MTTKRSYTCNVCRDAIRPTDGSTREVAVKVLRPNMLGVIDKDLELMRTAATWLERLSSDGKRLKPPGFKPPDIAGVLTRAQLGIYGLVETRRQAFYEMERICNLEQGPQAGHESLATFRASTMEKLVAVEAELKRRGYDPAGQPLESTHAERNE